MITGVGTDLIHLDRIEKVQLRSKQRFAHKVLGQQEYAVWQSRTRLGIDGKAICEPRSIWKTTGAAWQKSGNNFPRPDRDQRDATGSAAGRKSNGRAG